MKSLLMTTIAATVFGAGTAFAAPAIVTTPLHLRTGPSSGYPVETTMPAGAGVDVAGCTSGYGWCRVRWNGYDGWASSNYLVNGVHRRQYSRYGAEIGVPLIAGAVIGAIVGSHHDHDYHGRPHGYHDGHDHDRHDRDRDHHRGPARPPAHHGPAHHGPAPHGPGHPPAPHGGPHPGPAGPDHGHHRRPLPGRH